jgi:L-ascorbate metabolism protein UlaG (beta-lactamase superfamily)
MNWTRSDIMYKDCFHAQVVVMIETGDWISSQGAENVISFNIRDSVNVQGITISMTPAFHSSGISGKGENTVYRGEPAGYVIELENGLRSCRRYLCFWRYAIDS